MKSQNGSNVNITVVDTATNQSLVFNKDTHQVEAGQVQQESAGDLEQKGNKLSMEVDDNNKVEKEFDTPAQAAVAKAGIESGKFGGDVLLSEDDAEQVNEVMYNKPSEASDPFVEKPLNEDDIDDVPSINITFKNIDWNNEDLINNITSDMEDNDPVNMGDIESKINDLPDEAVITVRVDEIPMEDNASLEKFLFDRLGQVYAMKVNNAELANVEWAA